MRSVLVSTVAAVLAGVAIAATVTITQCPDDRYSCSGHSCQTFELPEGQCELNGGSNSTIRSQSFTCLPFAAICANIVGFGDTTCSGTPKAQNDLVCGKCYAQSNGGFMRPDCGYTNQGVPYMEMAQCQDAGCSQCLPVTTLKAGQCFPDHSRNMNGSSYLRSLGACSILSIAQYGTPDCSGAGGLNFIPARQCIDGTVVSCRDN